MFTPRFYAALSLFGLASTAVPVWACLETSALNTLSQQEMQYMLQRIPPAFADAVADQQVHGQLTLNNANDCTVRWQVTLPATDLAEAQAVLQADPAKQIMLNAQGYHIPETTTPQAVFSVDAAGLKPRHQDTLQTAELGKMRASIELMYAMLTQSRANQQTAAQPWSAQDQQALLSYCQQRYPEEGSSTACACYAQGLSAQYSPRQVRYNQYLASNPYAFASGNGGAYKQLEKSLQKSCGLPAIK